MRNLYIILAITLIPISAAYNAQNSNISNSAEGINTSKYLAHSGRTDRYGCHNDRKRGTYHCH